MRSRKYPNQTIDPVVYCDYYLLLEKNQQQLEQNQQQLE